MARFTGATLSVLGGVAGALFIAGAMATGCGGDDNGGTPSGSSSTNTTTKSTSSSTGSSTGTTSATSSTSATSASAGDAGDAGPGDAGDAGDGDATVIPPCNSVALLGDAGTLLFSFDDGGISATIGTSTANWQTQILSNPLDASFGVVTEGNSTVGEWCPGSLEMVVPFTTVGQGAQAYIHYPSTGAPYAAKAIHFSLRMAFPDNLDASSAYLQDILKVDGSNFSYLQVYAQWQSVSDAGAGDADADAAPPPPATGQTFVNVSPNGYLAFPADGGWTQQVVPIPAIDPGDGAVIGDAGVDTPILLRQIGLVVYDPQAADAGLIPLPFPLNVQFFIDDIWLE